MGAPSTKIICKSGRLSLIKKSWENSHGKIVEKSLLQTPDAVTIIPFIDSETIVLIKNYRLSLDETLWEFPAGTSEGEADFLDCAKRELQEETGYTARDWKPLFSFHPVGGLSAYKMHCYQASNLTHVGQNLDEDEQITVHLVNLEEAYQMLETGKIKDAKTQLLLYYLKTQG
jgi:ADP-ribose pyrophosphatase